MTSSPSRTALSRLIIVIVALLCVGSFAVGTAAAAPATSDALTICPVLGTAPVVSLTGAAECVPNDCASIAAATTGTDASCESTTPLLTLMSVPSAAAPPALANLRTPADAVAPAPAPGASWQTVLVRSLIGFGIGALLLAGAMAITSRRTSRADRSPTDRPAEAA
ncbi:MAG: hypothetical protein JWN41_581 [Thermoleophilia bacterium]|nr:hypothetical protein [Thermoleophilia bacterium]